MSDLKNDIQLAWGIVLMLIVVIFIVNPLHKSIHNFNENSKSIYQNNLWIPYKDSELLLDESNNVPYLLENPLMKR